MGNDKQQQLLSSVDIYKPISYSQYHAIIRASSHNKLYGIVPKDDISLRVLQSDQFVTKQLANIGGQYLRHLWQIDGKWATGFGNLLQSPMRKDSIEEIVDG